MKLTDEKIREAQSIIEAVMEKLEIETIEFNTEKGNCYIFEDSRDILAFQELENLYNIATVKADMDAENERLNEIIAAANKTTMILAKFNKLLATENERVVALLYSIVTASTDMSDMSQPIEEARQWLEENE